MIWLPDYEEVVEAHACVIKLSGGDPNIRDRGLIESAIARAFAGYGDYELYPSIEAKAAAICHGIASNHGFVDGNKRTGIAVMNFILAMNGIELDCTDFELVQLGLDIATNKADVNAVTEWILWHKRV